MTDYYPPPSFYFNVTIVGSASPATMAAAVDASFLEVSGIKAEFGVEEVTEGGENRFVYRLPKAAKYPNLVLKRGVVTTDSVLAEWVGATIGSSLALPIVTQNLIVTLLGESGVPIMAWGFVNAYPVRWDFSSLSAMENRILIETHEPSYNSFEP